MRKLLAAAALAGSIAGGLALVPVAAQASTASTASSPIHRWGNYFSGDHKAYAFGQSWKSNGKVYTRWNGRDFFARRGYVWFRYFSNGGFHSFYRPFDGSHGETWSRRGVSQVYTYTCYGSSPTANCGSSHRIY